jgi:hypothetical protein
MNRDLQFINFWKKELNNNELELWLDKLKSYSFVAWCVLLDEKLKRNEIHSVCVKNKAPYGSSCSLNNLCTYPNCLN